MEFFQVRNFMYSDWILRFTPQFFFLSGFSFTYTDDSQDSRGREGTIFYSTLPLLPAHEHSDIYLQLCTWDDYHIFLIAPFVFTRLLLDEIYHLVDLLDEIYHLTTRFTLWDLLRKSLYSVRIQENKDQKKLRIWKLFTQCPTAPPKCLLLSAVIFIYVASNICLSFSIAWFFMLNHDLMQYQLEGTS